MFGDAQPDILLCVQAEILAVKAQRLRMNIGGEADVNGINMGDKAHARRGGAVAASRR